MLALVSPLLLSFHAPTTLMSNAAARMAPVVAMAGTIPDKKVWVTFAQKKDITSPGTAIAGFQYGQEVAIVRDESNSLYALNNKIPPIGQPVTFCGIGKGVIEDPVTKTLFSLKTGQPIGDWCPARPLGLIYGLISAPTDLVTFPVRTSGDQVQVLINVNLKLQFESNYWRGVLDAQGKVDGGYY